MMALSGRITLISTSSTASELKALSALLKKSWEECNQNYSPDSKRQTKRLLRLSSQSINQSIDWSIKVSIDQKANNQSINQSINRKTSKQSINQSTKQIRTCMSSQSAITRTEHTRSIHCSSFLLRESVCWSDNVKGHFVGNLGKLKSQNSRLRLACSSSNCL